MSFFSIAAQEATVIEAEIFTLLEEGNDSLAMTTALDKYYQAEHIKDTLSMIAFAGAIGELYQVDFNYDKAKEYHMQALKLSQRRKHVAEIFRNNLGMGNAFFMEFNVLSQDSVQRVKAVTDSIQKYYEQIEEQTILEYPRKELQAEAFANLGTFNYVLKEYDKAATYIELATEKNKELNDIPNLLANQNTLGAIYIKRERFTEAEEVYKSIIALVETIKNKTADNIETQHYAWRNLATVYESTGDYQKALSSYEKSFDYYRNLMETLREEELSTIESQYNAERIRQEEQLNTAREATRRETFQKWTFVLTISVVALLVALLLRNRTYRLKRKNLQLSMEQERLEKEKQISELKTDYQIKVLGATLDGREIERKEIAQSLHDNVSSLLSSANMHLQVTKQKTATEIQELDKAKAIISEASGKIRDLSHELVSAVLLKFGLAHAISDVCEKYSNQKIQFECLSTTELPRFQEDFEIKVYNMIVECMNNIIKHSQANNATVAIQLNGNELRVAIEDNGKGFDTSIAEYQNGIGLGQIQARIKNLRGKLSIDSKLREGTQIRFWVPAQEV